MLLGGDGMEAHDEQHTPTAKGTPNVIVCIDVYQEIRRETKEYPHATN